MKIDINISIDEHVEEIGNVTINGIDYVRKSDKKQGSIHQRLNMMDAKIEEFSKEPRGKTTITENIADSKTGDANQITCHKCNNVFSSYSSVNYCPYCGRKVEK